VSTALGLRPLENGQRSAAPDQLKALLLVLVIFGHTYAEGVSEDLSKWTIYGFHMPAFLFLSGYLITTQRLTSRSLSEFFSHYARRMLVAWAVVSIIWLIWLYPDSFHGLRRFFHDFLLTPSFHLWYIPALFVALSLTWILARWRAGIIALAAIAVVGYFVFKSPLIKLTGFDEQWDVRYLGFLIFFVLGLALRNGWISVPPLWLRLVAIVVGAGLYLSAFWINSGWLSSLGFLSLNLAIGLSIPALLERISKPIPVIGVPLALIGEYSLWVYLLHPFVTRQLQIDDGSWLYQRAYGVGVTLLILVASVLVIVVWRRLTHRKQTV